MTNLILNIKNQNYKPNAYPYIFKNFFINHIKVEKSTMSYRVNRIFQNNRSIPLISDFRHKNHIHVK